MAAEVDRRGLLALSGAALALAGQGAAAVPMPARASGVLFFEPASPEARAAALAERGQRLIALEGDPMRLWRDRLAGHQGPVGGLTRWSDYLVLRSLAEERGLRVRREEWIATSNGPLIVRWKAT